MKKFFKKNERGFTLAELLIVVAIIGVLVAISIPIFTTQLEKSREAVDLANIRAAYAEMMTDVLTNPDTANLTKTVNLTQKTDDWQTSPLPKIGDVTMSGKPTGATHMATLTWTPATASKEGSMAIVCS